MRDLQYWETQIVIQEKAIESLSKRVEQFVTISALLMADVQMALRDAKRGLDDERMELNEEKRGVTATNK